MRTAAIALVLAALVTASPVHAEDRAAAERAFRTGERLFNAGQFRDAAGAFEDALATLPVPAIVFSTAQAHRLAWVKQGDLVSLRRSVELFRRYVSEVGTGQRVADATAALASLEPDLRAQEARGAIAGPGVPRATAFLVTSQVEGATAALDGGEASPLPRVLEVKPGPHTLVVAAEGYAPRTVTATALDGERLPVEVELTPLPARVDVRGEAGASVSVDGRPAGRLPLARPIEVDAGRHYLTVTRRGRRPLARELDLARGQSVAVTAPLPSTGQRRAVRWVFVGGGALALGAGATAWWASSLDGDAAAIRDRAATGGIDLAEAQRYDDLVARRDRAVTYTWVLGGAAAAAATAGVLLYLLDHEQPGATAPVVAPAELGAGASVGVSGRF